jgi:hypothetical protein
MRVSETTRTNSYNGYEKLNPWIRCSLRGRPEVMKHEKFARQEVMVTSPTELGPENDCAGEDQQQT